MSEVRPVDHYPTSFRENINRSTSEVRPVEPRAELSPIAELDTICCPHEEQFPPTSPHKESSQDGPSLQVNPCQDIVVYNHIEVVNHLSNSALHHESMYP